MVTKHLKVTLLIASCVILTACAMGSWPYSDTQKRNTFSQRLHTEYMLLANNQAEQEHKKTAIFLKERGMHVIQQEIPDLPIHPYSRDFTAQQKPLANELVQARARLIKALETTAYIEEPEKLAKAQANYDCWTENMVQSNGLKRDCQKNFENTIKQLPHKKEHKKIAINYDLQKKSGHQNNNNNTNTQLTSAQKKMLARYHQGSSFKQYATQQPSNIYRIYFDFNSVAITEEAQEILDIIATKLWKNPHSYKMLRIEGHTDLVGSLHKNMAVSLRRAQSTYTGIKKSLDTHKANIKIKSSMQGYGELTPAKPTPQTTREVANRRAIIKLYH